jgi:hypothetical protein
VSLWRRRTIGAIIRAGGRGECTACVVSTDPGERDAMAVMVTLTLKTDVDSYQALHGPLLGAAIPAGMLFHSAHEVDGGIAVVDFWPSAEAFKSFMEGPAADGMKAGGIPIPDDVEFTPVLNADGR